MASIAFNGIYLTLTMSNTAKELLDILDQVGESASFCVQGSLGPVLAGPRRRRRNLAE